MMTKTIFNTMPLLGKVKTIRWMAPMLVFSVLLVMGLLTSYAIWTVCSLFSS